MKVIEKDKPLPEHTKLDYYECYAKIVLEEMFPERFSNLIIIDKPDLQNEQLDIGVEVTSSVNSKQKEVEALYVKWHDQGDEGKKKIERLINKCGAGLTNRVLSGIPDYDNFDRINHHLKRKMKKIGKYKSFGKQYLFIFSYIYATSTMREKALVEMHRICTSASQKFDGIYVLVPGAIYVFDLANNITYERKINWNMQGRQAESAREMVIQEEKFND